MTPTLRRGLSRQHTKSCRTFSNKDGTLVIDLDQESRFDRSSMARSRRFGGECLLLVAGSNRWHVSARELFARAGAGVPMRGVPRLWPAERRF